MDIYRNIDRTKVQFDFIVHTNDVCDYENEAKTLGAIIFRLPRFTGRNFLAYRNAWQAFLGQSRAYSAVHIHVTNFAFMFLPLLKSIPMRIAHARSASDGSAVKRLLVKITRAQILKYCTHYLAVSSKAADFVFGKNTKGIIVVPNAIDAGMFAYNYALRQCMREKLKLGGSFVVGHVGRMSAEKNHTYLLQTVKVLQNQYPEIVLLFVGDGPLRGVLENHATEMGINVQFLGLRDDVPALMQAMDVFTLPSFFEGMPGAAIEAQAAGLPCVISDRVTKECGLIPSLVTFLPVGSTDVKKWAETIEKTRGLKRENTYELIKCLGFDAKTQALWYSDFYGRREKNSVHWQ
jgi:glycosyltransferase involved in cell wall biosynthesis